MTTMHMTTHPGKTLGERLIEVVHGEGEPAGDPVWTLADREANIYRIWQDGQWVETTKERVDAIRGYTPKGVSK